MGPNTHTAEWSLTDDDFDTALMGPATTHELDSAPGDVQLDDAARVTDISTGKPYEDSHSKTELTRDRPIGKPNKIYIGGLPDHTRPEDLRNCFGKLGNIVTIELKLGYGFVEFDSRESADESVARYHEGYFMGKQIRVEHSHSRGRTFKRLEDPGACFKCGESGHWARECPNPSTQSRGGAMSDPPAQDRNHSSRDYHNHAPRDTHTYREDYSRRDDRYYDTPPAPPAAQDRRRALTPPRDRPDYAPSRRDNEDYRMRSSPPPQPVSRYERTGHHGSDRDYTSSGAPTHRDRDTHGRYDRRAHASEDRSAPYQGQSRRPRTPPGPPPRDDYDKAPRGHHEARRRPTTPPPPYPGSSANGYRSRRRSVSPPPRYDSRYGGPSHADGDRHSGAPRETTRVRDYYRNSRTEDAGHRRS